MRHRLSPRENLELYLYAMKWLLIAALLSGVIGTGCAGFAYALEWATRARENLPWLLYALPVAGVLIGLSHRYFGKTVEGGALVVDEIHEPNAGDSGRETALSLFGTLATHLCGGSAGWEGPVMKAGGSLGSFFARKLDMLTAEDRRTALMTGVAGGFGAIFGTPLAGMVFAVEILGIDKLRFESLFPCLMAGLFSKWICGAWGVRRADFHLQGTAGAAVAPALPLMLKAALAGICFGLIGVLFSEALRGSRRLFRKVRQPLLRPVIGAAAIIALAWLFDTRDFLGLGVTSANPGAITIFSSLHGDAIPRWSWAGKALFTAATFGSGFKGGEVTPLLYIGAAFGNMLAQLLGESPILFAALGFVGVFAGATSAPLACTIMGLELFGSEHITLFAIACFSADFVGHSGIFPPSTRTLTAILRDFGSDENH